MIISDRNNITQTLPDISVLGVDPGSRFTGYGIVKKSGRDLICIGYGSIKLDTAMPLQQRLVVFSNELRDLILKYQVSHMAIENIFSAKNVQSVFKLGQIRGVAILISAQSGLEISEYAPATVKQAVAGYGRASKEQIQYMIQKILHLPNPVVSTDAADALAIAVCHITMQRITLRTRSTR